MLQRPENFQLNPHAPLANGLVFAGLGAHAGSAKYVDSSVLGSAGVNVGASWKPTSRNTFGVDYGGSINYATVLNNDALFNFASIEWTMSLWIKPSTSERNYGAIIERATGSNGSGGWSFQNQVAPVIRMMIDGTVYNLHTLVAATENHVCIRFLSTGTFESYLNGGDKKTGGKAIPSSSIPLIIGNTRSPYNYGCESVLSDVSFWKRYLSLPEIQQLADPSNVMLSGLILPPARKWWPVVSGGGPAATPIPVFLNQYRQRVA